MITLHNTEISCLIEGTLIESDLQKKKVPEAESLPSPLDVAIEFTGCI